MCVLPFYVILQIGVGIAENKSGLKSYVVALLNPRENIKDKLTENVLPVTGKGLLYLLTLTITPICRTNLYRDGFTWGGGR